MRSTKNGHTTSTHDTQVHPSRSATTSSCCQLLVSDFTSQHLITNMLTILKNQNYDYQLINQTSQASSLTSKTFQSGEFTTSAQHTLAAFFRQSVWTHHPKNVPQQSTAIILSTHSTLCPIFWLLCNILHIRMCQTLSCTVLQSTKQQLPSANFPTFDCTK